MGTPTVTPDEATMLLREIPDWDLVERDGVQQLTRTVTFKTFAEALAFTNQVGERAEQEGHHPALMTEGGSVTSAGGPIQSVGCIGTTSSWRRRRISSTASRGRVTHCYEIRQQEVG